MGALDLGEEYRIPLRIGGHLKWCVFSFQFVKLVVSGGFNLKINCAFCYFLCHLNCLKIRTK